MAAVQYRKPRINNMRGATENVTLLLRTIRETYAQGELWKHWNQRQVAAHTGLTARSIQLYDAMYDTYVKTGEREVVRLTPRLLEYAIFLLYPSATPEQEAQACANTEHILWPLMQGRMPDGSDATPEKIVAYGKALADERLPLVRLLHFSQTGALDDITLGDITAEFGEDAEVAAAAERLKELYRLKKASGTLTPE